MKRWLISLGAVGALAGCGPSQAAFGTGAAATADPCRTALRVRSRGFGYYDDTGVTTDSARRAAVDEAVRSARSASARVATVEQYASACDNALAAAGANDEATRLTVLSADGTRRVPNAAAASAAPPLELEGDPQPFPARPAVREIAVEVDLTYACSCGAAGKGDSFEEETTAETVDGTDTGCFGLESWASSASCLSADDAAYCVEQASALGCSASLCANTCDGAAPIAPDADPGMMSVAGDYKPAECALGQLASTSEAEVFYGAGATREEAIAACVGAVFLDPAQLANDLACESWGGHSDLGYSVSDVSGLPEEIVGSYLDIEGALIVSCTVTPICCSG